MFIIILYILFWITLFLIIYPYLIYPLILLILSKILKRPVQKSAQNKNITLPLVTIIIPAYNEKNIIAEKIKNCLNIDYPKEKLEILIGSDGSNDGTNEIVSDYVKENNLIKFIAFEKRRGKISVVNDLAFIAKGEILLFSDANCMLNSQCLNNIIKHFALEDVGCVSGVKKIITVKNDNISSNEGIYWRFESLLKKMESNIYSLIGSDGAIFAIKKEFYEKQETDTIIDDFMISMRVLLNKKKRIIYEENAVALEASEGNYKDEYKRKVRIAAGAFQSLRRLRFTNLFSFEGFAFFSHKILRWFSPVFFILFFISNFLLAIYSNFIFYKFIFFLQLLYYILTLAGYISNIKGVKNKLLDFIFYFNMTVFSQLIGFIKYKKGNQKVTWEKQNR